MQQRFLLQILLLAQHVSVTIMSAIQWLLPVVFRAVVFQVAGLVWSCELCVRFAGCPSSGAQEYYTVVAACGISCCGFQVAGLVWS